VGLRWPTDAPALACLSTILRSYEVKQSLTPPAVPVLLHYSGGYEPNPTALISRKLLLLL
jgi:hypothetical protein